MPSEIEEVVRLCLSRRVEGALDIPARRLGFDNRVELGKVSDDVIVEPVDAGGVPAEWLNTPNVVANRVLLYLHGGGYCWGSLDSHRPLVAAFARATGARVLFIDYRRAPEHRYPAALDDALTAYRWLRSTGDEATACGIAGDSAGGGLTLATLLALRDAGDPLPNAAVAISPWTDMTGSGNSYTSRADADPICSHDMLMQLSALYRGTHDPRDPYVSPVFGDFTGIPPLLVQVGEAEVMYDDSVNVVERARACGVDVTFESVPDMVHVWHLFAPMLGEGRAAIARAGEFLSDRLAV